MKEDTMAKIRKALLLSDNEENNRLCFPCHGGVTRINWLPSLQDALEDSEIDLEHFCAVSNHNFYVKRGRLRHEMQCVNISVIEKIIDRYYAET